MPTLEQQRAQDAWEKCAAYKKEHVNLAKGLPALMMNSGLMQTIAFLHEKKGHHEAVSKHLRQWLKRRYPRQIKSTEFEPFMEAVLSAKPDEFRAITTEAFAWLKWLRQMSAARLSKGD